MTASLIVTVQRDETRHAELNLDGVTITELTYSANHAESIGAGHWTSVLVRPAHGEYAEPARLVARESTATIDIADRDRHELDAPWGAIRGVLRDGGAIYVDFC